MSAPVPAPAVGPIIMTEDRHMTTIVKSAPFPAIDLARNPSELEILRAFRQIPDEEKTACLAKLAEIVASIKPAKGKRRSGARASERGTARV